MYCGISPSRTWRAVTYPAASPVLIALPLSCRSTPDRPMELGTFGVGPPSSAYWIHKSASTCSSALRNVRIAMSPLVIGARSSPSAKAAGLETSPTPAVIAPAATMPFFKNDRRLLRPLNTVPSFFISFSFSRVASSVPNGRSHTRTPARATLGNAISPSPAFTVGLSEMRGVTAKSSCCQQSALFVSMQNGRFIAHWRFAPQRYIRQLPGPRLCRSDPLGHSWRRLRALLLAAAKNNCPTREWASNPLRLFLL